MADSSQQSDKPPIEPALLDDIVRFLTDRSRSGFGEIVLKAEGRQIVRATFQESRKYNCSGTSARMQSTE